MFTPASDRGWQLFLEGLSANDPALMQEGEKIMAAEARRLAVFHKQRRG